ncbi:MAG TPA: ROK family protein [Candidatus Saccharimonadales bacterium]|nr:ROK family protein [Candidatus Saccharimonadales bacterium]
MYLGVDIGGTKTLIACLNKDGVIQEKVKFPTPKEYGTFLNDLAKIVASLSTKNFLAAGVAVPGRLDREKGIGIAFGNLPWKEVAVRADVQRIVKCPVVIENDANLAGLSEAMLLKEQYGRVLYVTISTGINMGLIVGQHIDTSLHPEAGNIMMEHHGRLETWEHFASGRAIVHRFGKQASEITDDGSWKIIAHNIAIGLADLVAIIGPEIIVLGGSIGGYFDQYAKALFEDLKELSTPLTPMPPIIKASRPDDAVVYGCYDLIRELYEY